MLSNVHPETADDIADGAPMNIIPPIRPPLADISFKHTKSPAQPTTGQTEPNIKSIAQIGTRNSLSISGI